jgi:hypothetical protein
VRLAATQTSTTKAVGDLAALVDDRTRRYMASPNDASPTSRALFDGRRAELGCKVAQPCGSVPERF